MTQGPWKASGFLELHDYNAPSETEWAGESRMYCELVSRLIVMVYLLGGTSSAFRLHGSRQVFRPVVKESS